MFLLFLQNRHLESVKDPPGPFYFWSFDNCSIEVLTVHQSQGSEKKAGVSLLISVLVLDVYKDKVSLLRQVRQRQEALPTILSFC